MNINNINLYEFLMEQIYNRTVELYEISSKNKEKNFELVKKFNSNGNKTNWDDVEEYNYVFEDIKYTSCRVVNYTEPDIYGDDLVEIVYFNLKDMKNIEDLEILDHLKFKIRKSKIQNIIQ